MAGKVISSNEKKVRRPHPLMQLGSPSVDVEMDHVAKFTVFRQGGSGPPVHVETIEAHVIDPSEIHKRVGGGRYIVRALANEATSGRTQGSVINAVQYEWDGQPLIKASPVTPYGATAPTPNVVEQAATSIPTLVTAFTGVATAALGIMAEMRNAREASEQRRREYDDRKHAEERTEREAREAKAQREAEDRRQREQTEAEDRRAERERLAEERRQSDQRREDALREMQRQEAEARQRREDAIMGQLLNRRDPNEAIMQTLLQRALTPAPAPPAQPAMTVDAVLDAAKKLKEFGDSGDQQMIAGIVQAIAPTSVGQEILARGAAMIGLYPTPQQQPKEPEPAVVVTEPPPAVSVPQIPPRVDDIPPGPVAIVN